MDRIFKFIDYGHASIGGLTGGIPITIDHCSMYLAYKIFDIAQLVDGQESSTRYITMKPSSLLSAEEAGIPEELRDEWTSVMSESFEIYQELFKELDDIATKDPSKMNIPANLPEKVQTRIRKNYALDRARYFIPMATKTSAAYIMTARVWAQTLKELESIPLKEAQDAAVQIREELGKFAPRLIRHSFPDEASKAQAEDQLAYSADAILAEGVPTTNTPDEVMVSLHDEYPSFLAPQQELAGNFAGKTNRYSMVGVDIRRKLIRAGWNNMALAELRDLNRHRSGFRFTPMIPTGFYLPQEIAQKDFSALFSRYSALITKHAEHGYHYYGYLLGTQVGFEHSTHLDKFIYEIELRTGMGAHFRYADHLNKAYDELMKVAPELAPFIVIGDAEPE